MNVIRKMIILPNYTVKPDDQDKPEYIQATDFLAMVRLCREFNCLPQPGSLLEQDSLFIHLLMHVIAQEDSVSRQKERDAQNAAK